MDARGFSNFLSKRLSEALNPLENNILNLVSQDLDRNVNLLYRSAGARDVLKDILNKLDPLLNEYQESGV